MAGLLDVFNTPEGMQGLSLLAAAGPSMEPQNLASRIAQAGNTYRGMQQGLLRDKLLNAQIDNLGSEADARRASLAKTQAILDLFKSDAPVPGASMATTQPGQLGSGSFGIVPPPAGSPAIPQAGASSASRIGALTPDKLAQLKLLGVDLTDVYKLTQPDMQVSNGYAYDKNSIRSGFLPQLNIARDGQASMVQIGPDGLPVVSAPQGAYPTYAGYKNLEQSAQANFDPVTVTPQGQNPQMTTRGNLVRNPLVRGQVTPQQQAAMDADRKTILQGELTKAQQQYNAAIASRDQSAAARAQADMAAINRELGRSAPSVGLPLQSKEEEQRNNLGVEADAKLNTTLSTQAAQSRDVMANINRARELLSFGPTASGVGALVDKGNSFFGYTTNSANVASALDNVSGWLTANVPRMEGPQSDRDVDNYKVMAGRVGDRSLPVAQRIAALDELERMQKKYERFNGPNTGATVPNQVGAGSNKSTMLNELPKTAPKGQRVRDTATGKVLQFNGLSWVEVK